MYEFKCNDAIKILVPEDNKINICILDETYVSYAGPLSVRLDEMHGRYIEKINEELSVVKTDERPSMFIIIETKYINLSDSQSILTKEEEKTNKNIADIIHDFMVNNADGINLKEKDENKMQNNFNIGDRVKINFQKDSGVDQSIIDKFNGKKGLCTAIGERTYVNIKVDNEYIFLPEKFVTLYEKAQEEESNIIPDDKIRIFKEDKEGENFVIRLRNSLGVKDNEIFIVDKNNFMCYFEHGEFFLVNPETHEKISDNTLRGKIFYGLANGTISRLSINTPFPKYAEAYYFWETNYISTTEPLQINRRIWRNRLEDYIRFIAGNCFPTKEACKNNINTVGLIKNKAFLKQYGKD